MTATLIVDDSTENLYLLEVLLKSKGFQVRSAHNGNQALEMVGETPPDLIISDILMPGMDGFSFCREVKADAALASIPFIFYTATYTDEKDEAYALALGADRFIRKPMQPDLFLDQITEVVREHEAAHRPANKPLIMDEDETYKLYSERLVQKLEKKMLDLEAEITRRQALEADLRQARNEWEETFQAIASPALMLDADFNILHANRAAVDKLQTTERDLIKKKCYQVFHHTDEPHLKCPMEQLLNKNQAHALETEIEALGGTYLLNCAPLKRQDGQIEKIIHIAVDINARKKAERELQQSEARYRRMTDNAKDMIYRMRLPDGVYEFVSPASEALFGYPPETWYAAPKLIQGIIHPDWVDYFRVEWEKLVNGEMSPTYEYQIIHKDGAVRWMNQRNTLVKNPDGEPIAIEAFVTDITERKQIEEDLKTSEERFLQLVENINELFWIRDARSDAILYLSPTFEKIFGMQRDKMFYDSHAFMDAVLKEDRPQVETAHYEQVHLGKTTDVTYRIRRDDEIRWLRAKAFPIRNSEGKVVRIAGVAEDFTEREKAARRRQKLESQLVQSQKIEAIGTLAGGIAHDFNNILSSIIGFTELSLEGQDPRSNLSDNLNEVMAAGLRAKELVQQILTLARKSEEEFKPVQVRKVAEEALKMLRAAIPTNIEILQELASGALVLAPPGQIHQVIVNLVTNAAHAMHAAGGVLEVGLSEERLAHSPTEDAMGFVAGRYIKMTVADNGQGIPEAYLTEIFNPYFTTKEIGEGTGLGLSVTHGIVQKCGGLISVQSTVGKGTRFTIYLPVLDKAAPQKRSAPSALPFGSERIMIVDDEAAIAKMTAQRLERLGYTVTSITSSVEALDRIKEQPEAHDLILTDMAMPQMTGDQLAAAILGLRSDIPIIICTGFSARLTAAAAKEMGIKALVMKPITIEDLAHTIRRVLDER